MMNIECRKRFCEGCEEIEADVHLCRALTAITEIKDMEIIEAIWENRRLRIRMISNMVKTNKGTVSVQKWSSKTSFRNRWII